MLRIAGLSLAALLLALPSAAGARPRIQGRKAKILLIGKDRDHPPKTHEYMAVCELLAKCLRQTAGVEAAVSNGWPKDPETLKDVRTIVLYTAMGGDVLFGGPNRDAATDLMEKGTGLVALHWATGGTEGSIGGLLQQNLGGWFHPTESKYLVQETTMARAAPDHPVCRGLSDFKLKDEFYIKLRFEAGAKPVFKAKIDSVDHTVGWVFERGGNGRSFGTVIGHFHENFGNEAFRRAIVNGILWAAHLEVPKGGAPVKLEPKDLELPPDARK
jgi:type 1 glutamine amidotransferase